MSATLCDLMRARIVTELVGVGPRAACSDAERRAARLLARELKANGRTSRIETAWVRPQWPAIWLLHAILGIAGSVLSVDAPAVAVGILAFAGVSAAVELSGRGKVIGLLMPRRATQNVVSESPDRAPVRLIVTAPYDAPRAQTAFVGSLSRLDGAVRRITRGWWPHPLGLLALSLAVLTACAGARLGDVESTALGAVQLVPTIACILAVAVLSDLAFARAHRGANAHASAAAVALALVAALDERPPRRMAVDLVLAGAGEGPALGMRAFVRSRRATKSEEVAVLHLDPCAAGQPVAVRSAGPLLPVRLHPQLVRLSGATVRSRRVSGALVARRARWPAIAIGCVDERGQTPERLEPAALEGALASARALVAALDGELAGRMS
jgi:hypothetical protein